MTTRDSTAAVTTLPNFETPTRVHAEGTVALLTATEGVRSSSASHAPLTPAEWRGFCLHNVHAMSFQNLKIIILTCLP